MTKTVVIRQPATRAIVINRPITRIVTINRGLKGEDFTPSTTDSLAEGIANLYFTVARARAAAVADSISDGVTDVAPSQNAVFDALAGKQNALGYTPENAANKGAANGYAGLDSGSKVAATNLPIDTDATFAANSDTLVASQKAVRTALNLKADLSLANFAELQLGTKQVAAYEQGSNVNGRWHKWLDKTGSTIAMYQQNPARTTRSSGDTVTFPASFPDANWKGDITAHDPGRALFITFTGSINETRFIFGCRNSSTLAIASCLSSWDAWWVKT